MMRELEWRKSLGARLGLLSVAILVSAILLIAADFRMLGEIDAAKGQTNTLGRHRSDAYQLLALTARLTRDTGEERVRTLVELSDLRRQIDARFETIRERELTSGDQVAFRVRVSDVGPQNFWRSQVVPALDHVLAGTDPNVGSPGTELEFAL